MGKKSHSRFSETANPFRVCVALATTTTQSRPNLFPICVFLVKWVSAFTMSFFQVLSTYTFAPSNIFNRRSKFNMGGVHTSPVTAKMVTNQMVRHNFNKHSADQSVGELCLNTDDSADAIAVNVLSGSPFPTGSVIEKVDSGYLNLRKEAGKNCASNGNTVRIVEGHFSLLFRLNLARAIKGRNTFGGPSFILA